MSDYAYWKAWRLANPKTRNRQRKTHYAKTRDAANRGQEWTNAEMEAITADDRPADKILSGNLGRSVQAIQVKRAKIRHSEREAS